VYCSLRHSMVRSKRLGRFSNGMFRLALARAVRGGLPKRVSHQSRREPMLVSLEKKLVSFGRHQSKNTRSDEVRRIGPAADHSPLSPRTWILRPLSGVDASAVHTWPKTQSASGLVREIRYSFVEVELQLTRAVNSGAWYSFLRRPTLPC